MQMKFNKQQLEAINSINGAIAVIAGAGSGKSTVLVNRIKEMVDNGINQKDILAISFTRNTSKDLKYKLSKMSLNNVNTGTFHAICSRILIKEGYDLSKNKKIREFEIENLFKRINKKSKIDLNDIMGFISYQKNYMKSYNDEFIYKESKYSDEELRVFYKEYEAYKKKKELLDYDDLLLKGLKILKEKPNKYTYKYILVDEHQDSNLIQNNLIKLLCPSGNVFCIGDFRQCIYGFRGAIPKKFMNFKKDYPNAKIINLDINYRSKNNIVNNANNFIKKYYGDYEYYSDSIANAKEKGHIKIYDSIDKEKEAEKIVSLIEDKIKQGEKLDNIAILYRLNSDSIYIENQLKSKKIEYYIDNNSSFFKRKEISVILSCLRLIENPHDDSAFDLLLKFRFYPFTYLSNNTIDKLKEFSALNDLSLFQSCTLIKCTKQWEKYNMSEFYQIINKLSLQYKKHQNLKKLIDNIIKVFKIKEHIKDIYADVDEMENRLESLDVLKTFVKGNDLSNFITYVYSEDNNKKDNNKKDKVQLMTIHKSKGLEFKNVFIVGLENKKFPHKKSDLKEEARLFYVGVTRAKENLYLSEVGKGNVFIKEYTN